MTVSARTRKAVYERDGHECVLARVSHHFSPCSGPLTVQHTVSRGMGSSKLFDTPDLLVTMCNGHNILATSDANFARYCTSRGLVRSRNSTRNPRLVPVHYWDGWYLLEGTIRVPVHQLNAEKYMRFVGAIRDEMVA